MMLERLLSKTGSARGLAIDDAVISWSGPVDEAAPAVLVEWRLERAHPLGERLAQAAAAGDAAGVDEVVRQLPLPTTMLAELAARCLDQQLAASLALVSGRVSSDLRWLRALTRVAAARSLSQSLETADASIETILVPSGDRQLRQLRCLPDGPTAALESRWGDESDPPGARLSLRAADGSLRGVELPGSPKLSWALPTPVRADPAALVVTAYDDEAHVVTAWLFAGSEVQRAWHGKIDSEPQQFSISAAGLWLHCHQHHVLLDGACARDASTAASLPSTTAVPDPKIAFARGSDHMEGRLEAIGRWLPAFSRPVLRQGVGWISERLSWIDLDAELERRTTPWDHEMPRLAFSGGALYIASTDGLWKIPAQSPAERILEGSYFGICIEPDTYWLGSDKDLIRYDRSANRQLWRVTTRDLVFDILRLTGGVLALSSFRWSWYDDAGNLVDAGDSERDVGWSRLQDGTLAVSAGRQVIVIGADGKLRRRAQLPYDGQIVGATATHFIYGPVDGGIPRIEPDALYALDAEGNVTSRYPTPIRPCRVFYGGGSTGDNGAIAADAVVIVERDGPLRRWDPASRKAAAATTAMMEPKRRVERGVSSVKWNTVNPRDDWPEPGLLASGEELCAIGGEYGGSTGVCRGPAVQVDDHAIATLVGCKLTNGGWLRGNRSGTIILVDCKIEASSTEMWWFEDRCHVALVDCTLEGAARVRLDVGGCLSVAGTQAIASGESVYQLGAPLPLPVAEAATLPTAASATEPPVESAPVESAPASSESADDLRVWFERGVSAARHGELDSAAAWLRRILEQDPRHYDAWYNLGLVQSNQQSFEEALRSFRRVLELSPDNHPALFQLGSVLEQLGKRDEALAAYRDAVRTSPDPHGAFAYSGIDCTERARDAIERLLGRD
jgi:tetratricopeptide repeat protein